MRVFSAVVLVLGVMPYLAFAQGAADQSLLAEINRIRAVDNHTHVPKVVAAGEKDDDYDALPCYLLEPSADPLMARPENQLFLQAWQKLFDYKYNDRDPAHVRELIETKRRIRSAQGDNYPAWVLDKLGIEYMFANRVAMGRGLTQPRFRWVPFDDALLLPLNNQAMEDTPDRKAFYQREEMLLKRYLTESNVAAIPAILDNYVEKVVTPTLERQQKAGAVAVKFEAAYLRSLNFAPPQAQEAREIFARYVKGGVPTQADYIKVQDFLLRAIAAEAGRLGLAVHFHTGTGCGGYFDLAGSNPNLLNSLLNDASLRKTNFVLIHGGAGPYTKAAAVLMGKPNVYADVSEQILISTHALSGVIRDWLEWYPEKVMFATDLSPGTPETDWEESGYVAATRGREALAIALTGMINDGEITRDRALELARMALRDNAIKLYGLSEK
ncbi:MAG TPA: amidohydrolase family protein [Terriglobales bacterium]|nr:amidohydrolase family protein [Terriglobales bacterium]